MRIPGISINELKRLGKARRALSLVFKIGLPLGAAVLVFGTVVAGLRDPQHLRHQVPPRVSGVAEIIMAVACVALALNLLLEGMVDVKGFAPSFRLGISGAIAYVFMAAFMGSIAFALALFSYRDLFRR